MINDPEMPADQAAAGPVFGHIEPIPLTERVTAALKNAFFSGQLKPGDSIVERQVAREMNVGTPVVREALIDLKHQGFVRRVNNKGSSVTKFETEEVRQLYMLRIELETLSLQWARTRVTTAEIDELKRLADALAKIPGVSVENPQTNIVFFDPTEAGVKPADFVPAILSAGVRMGFLGGRVRAVTQLDISADDVDRAVEIIRKVLKK